ncbi:MAG: tRNA (adenosine(37)-N6)-threonylcarbamoyltransferase complex dimerization subunit type 1 TsaB [Nitrospirae bacterium RIFOXYB2_FULL_43_5]|nr:MAG: tRNA (adenosine(37)-N6)-threonylcarbamoyltransferase complex dimerization subunit type 1 TsaB [Nitrospirae bacterium GWF2_44_13]OGW63802.1 MAG: tRNA (adenosine(37)-N6)-threonylcarbamoyltransferase complex dimerization subunit type 1 TsaB [Nitrospirae bacterium RIFOXYA2_FULL_44_9]OGW73622.1 MAG: tRNA (adenosine(37)-N6)-threonylcarbamoyltransferase complex dimerization subunit type 1 TsaB [Nitrospirae bacterium RIFOXYB2_FULL_43_5]OGW74421.1 MAG: tRNA (adenosine(37)-N6)-threonylcarbamoyltra
MKILAIDTSTMLGGIAIMDESLLIAESRLNVKSTHSERLMTEIEHCLKQSGVKISDIDVFAVATGPGSFTGLRIGLSTVKGFSYATGKPIVSVPTLEALAWNFPYSRYPVCTMLDARKKEVYAALFRWEGENLIRLLSETSAKPEEFIRDALRVTHVADSTLRDDKFIFAGEGATLYRDKIIEAMGEKAIFASPEKTVPSPANVAVLGLKKAKAGEFSEPVSLAPMYIRKSEAEVKWSKIR